MTKRNVHAARTPNASAKKASAAIATAMSKRIMSKVTGILYIRLLGK